VHFHSGDLIGFEDCALLSVAESHSFENSSFERIQIAASAEVIADFASSKCDYPIDVSIEGNSQLRYLDYGIFLKSKIMNLTLSDCAQLSTFVLNIFESAPLQQISRPSNLNMICSNCVLKSICLKEISWSDN
jgi:hypothetical protein